MTISKHLIVLSFDAMSSEDYQYMKNLPNFKFILDNGTHIAKVNSVYPTLTYPAHTSIITGMLPKNHGIVNNTLFQPGRMSPDWYWYRKYIKCPTLYDLARKKGLKTAALLWPVTAGANIDYNLPEIWPNKWYENQALVSLLSGTLCYVLKLNNKFGKLRKGISQPFLDDFILQSTLYTIKSKMPNLLLVHFTDVDTNRHLYGYNSKEAVDAIHRHDFRLGEILKATKDTGIYEDTTFVILGDHSALDEHTIININVLFKEKGLITVDSNGELKDWEAYFSSCDGSGYVYLKSPHNSHLIRKVEDVLIDYIKRENSGIEALLNKDQAISLGANDTCSFMLEAKKGYYFLENYTGNILEKVNESLIGVKKHYTMATHGYSPLKPNYSTMFAAMGKNIKKCRVIPEANIIDEGPTLAKILGISMKNTDGKIISDLFI